MQANSRNQNSITRQDLIAFKSATAAAPTTQMQVIRLFEHLHSSISHIGAVAINAATSPSKGRECARKGGHILVGRSTAKAHFCHECGSEVFSSTDLRPEVQEEAAPQPGGRLTTYWMADGHSPLHVR